MLFLTCTCTVRARLAFLFFCKGIWLSVSAESEIHVGAVEKKLCPSSVMKSSSLVEAVAAEVSAHAIFTVPDTVKCYSLTELPITYHAAYMLLEKAVQTLRSKTSKVYTY